jgi:uncharacterized protein YyaL (SSP411 family)
MPLSLSASPYLRAHADDPVAWRDWSPTLLDEAAAVGRPLFISVGYLACHWCNVMHRESFLHEDIARRLNERFLPVKVDRELNPALDGYLLEFLRATRGFAGWPLNVVVLPTGDALTGLVYAPVDEFAAFLDRIHAQWERDPEGLTRLAAAGRLELQERMRAGDLPLSPARARRLPELFWERLEASVDWLGGGLDTVTRFPRAPLLQAVCAAVEAARAPAWAEEFLSLTLEAMGRKGLRDVLSGGFFRYSETPDWGRPHFEMMLEDQAQLAKLYLDAGRILGVRRWREWGYETVEFMLSEMAVDEGPRFAVALSAIDADGIEGGFYLWTEDQLVEALSGMAHPDWVRAHFALHPRGASMDGGYLPTEPRTIAETSRLLEVDSPALEQTVREGRERLRATRARRARPRDEQSPLAAQGLVLSALAAATEHPPSARAGARLARALAVLAEVPKSLPRMMPAPLNPQRPSSLAGAEPMRTSVSLTLWDVVYLARGLQDWSQATGEHQSELVPGLLQLAWGHFFDGEGLRTGIRPDLPGMSALRLHPEAHRPSPSTMLLDLTHQYATVDLTLAERLRQFPGQPGRVIEQNIIDHAGWVLSVAKPFIVRGGPEP